MTENNEQPVVDPTQTPEPVGIETPRDVTQPEPTQSIVENPSRPEPTGTDPHPVDEDPETQPVGQELTDPWAEGGTEWPSVESQVEAKKDPAEESDSE
jgi:hypothetical protein